MGGIIILEPRIAPSCITILPEHPDLRLMYTLRPSRCIIPNRLLSEINRWFLALTLPGNRRPRLPHARLTSPDRPLATAAREYRMLAPAVSRETPPPPVRVWEIGRPRPRIRRLAVVPGRTVDLAAVARDDTPFCNAVANQIPPVPMCGTGGNIAGVDDYSLRPNARRSYCSLA
jgi:hypothetical protein